MLEVEVRAVEGYEVCTWVPVMWQGQGYFRRSEFQGLLQEYATEEIGHGIGDRVVRGLVGFQEDDIGSWIGE